MSSDNGGMELMGDSLSGGGLLSRAASLQQQGAAKPGGLMSAASAAQQQAANGALPQGGGTRPSEKSPDEDFQQWLSQAMMLVHSPETRDAIAEQLRSPDQVKALSGLLVMIVQRIDVASRESGVEVDDQVKIYGAKEILDQLVEVAKADNSINFSLDDDHIELAFSVAIQDYLSGEIEAGRIDRDRLKAKTEQTLRNSSPEQLSEIDGVVNRIASTAKKYSPAGGEQQQGGVPANAQRANPQEGVPQ